MIEEQGQAGSRVSADKLTAFCVNALVQVGVSHADAATAAEVLVTTDTFGVFTHGVKCLRGYVRRLRGGGLRANAAPAVVAEGPGWALVDGQAALGMVTSTFAMNQAIAKARASGVGYAGVRNSCHFGAAGLYALIAVRSGMIGLAVGNDHPSVTVPGARGCVLGSNPLAYAVPAGQERPIFMDIATSAVAGGKVYQAQVAGKTVPGGWLVDEAGLPTTDPTGFPERKTLVPMAAHKGYGLALLIETLAAVLTGAAVANRVGSWIFDDPALATNHGAAFIAIDVGAIMPIEAFKQRVDHLIRHIRQAPLAQGATRILLPGEMEWDRREHALAQGIPLPDDVIASLKGLASDLKMAELPPIGFEGPPPSGKGRPA